MIRGNPCRAILVFVIKVTMQFVFFYNKLKLFEKCNIYYILYAKYTNKIFIPNFQFKTNRNCIVTFTKLIK